MRIAINGFGRIGRSVFRLLNDKEGVEVVAINDLADSAALVYLLRHDTVMGNFQGVANLEGDVMVTKHQKVKMTEVSQPTELPWGEMGIDFVVEATGRFRKRAEIAQHIEAGARKVLLTVPAKDEIDATIVLGVNHEDLKPEHLIVSNASCTTNCLAPLAQVLHQTVGIVHGLMTTIHAYTNDQVLTDVYHADLRRARSATMSQIPTKTGAAAAVGLVLPELNGKLDGFAMRVPTINVSVVDLTFVAARATSVAEIDGAVRAAAEGRLKGILGINTQPLVSVDFNHDPRSSTYDATQTRVMDGTLVKVLSWYDNEWGFSNRMLDMTLALMAAK